MVTGILGKIMWPPVSIVQNMIYSMFSL